jgi:uncharacterized protein YuzE
MNIAKIAKVGGHIFNIELVDVLEDGKICGICYYREERILLAKYARPKKTSSGMTLVKLPKRSILATLEHELLHAVDYVYNANTLSENAVDRLSEGLYSMRVNNPKLFK